MLCTAGKRLTLTMLTILGGTELSSERDDHLQKVVTEETVFSGG